MSKNKYNSILKKESSIPDVEAMVEVSAEITDNAAEVVHEITEAQESNVKPEVMSEPVVENIAPIAETSNPLVQPKKGFTPVYKIELELTNYAEAMDVTKSLTLEECGAWQYSLFNTIRNIFNAKDQQEFNNEFNTVLAFFHKNRSDKNKNSIFNENFIFKAPMNWPGSSAEFTLYRRLIFTIIQIADPVGRKKALADINLALVTEGLTEDQRSKFITFCS